jgi:MOSC domain-containing protein YiiM
LPDKPPVIDSHRQADAAEWRISPTNGKAKLSGEPADFRGIRIFAMGAFTIEGIVAGVFVSGSHTFSKRERQSITLLPGLGIEGDAHCGPTVQHLSDRKKYPNRPNLRQLHLIQTELIEELNATGFDVRPGDLGENITTRRIDLPALPQGALLRIGDTAVVEITGLRTPCSKIERFRKELRRVVTEHRHAGPATLKSAVMAIVGNGGVVKCDDRIVVIIPGRPHRTLEPV